MHISLSWVSHAASQGFTRKAVALASPHLSDSLSGTQTQVTHTGMLTTLPGHWIVLPCSTQRAMPKVTHDVSEHSTPLPVTACITAVRYLS